MHCVGESASDVDDSYRYDGMQAGQVPVRYKISTTTTRIVIPITLPIRIQGKWRRRREKTGFPLPLEISPSRRNRSFAAAIRRFRAALSSAVGSLGALSMAEGSNSWSNSGESDTSRAYNLAT